MLWASVVRGIEEAHQRAALWHRGSQFWGGRADDEGQVGPFERIGTHFDDDAVSAADEASGDLRCQRHAAFAWCFLGSGDLHWTSAWEHRTLMSRVNRMQYLGRATPHGTRPDRTLGFAELDHRGAGRRSRMTLYVDSSALLKRYIDEHDSATAVELMAADPVLVTSRLTEVEVRRNLTRLLAGDHLTGSSGQRGARRRPPSRRRVGLAT